MMRDLAHERVSVQRQATKHMKIAVIGLGYVGLPLSFQFARSGVTVLGLDIDTAKVDALNQGKSYIKHIPADAVADALKSDAFSASNDFRSEEHTSELQSLRHLV